MINASPATKGLAIREPSIPQGPVGLAPDRSHGPGEAHSTPDDPAWLWIEHHRFVVYGGRAIWIPAGHVDDFQLAIWRVHDRLLDVWGIWADRLFRSPSPDSLLVGVVGRSSPLPDQSDHSPEPGPQGFSV